MDFDLLDEEEPKGLELELDDGSVSTTPEAVTTENEDGSVTVDFGGDDEEGKKGEIEDAAFDDNLAEFLSDDELSEISTTVLEFFQADMASRSDWEEGLTTGLDLLGIKMEDRTVPWKGAAGVFDPILMEAVVRFQSQAIMEIFPPAGPAKTQIKGKDSPERKAQAVRVQDEMNYQLTVRMKDYRAETERLLFSLGLSGAAFRKTYYDPQTRAPCSKFVPAEDFVVPYGDSTLATAERFTHVQRLTQNQMKRLQARGFYRKIDLSDPVESTGDVEDKKSELTGVSPNSPTSDRYTVLEMHVPLEFEDGDFCWPYIVCVEKESGKVLSIRRNWKEGDEEYEPRSWFTAYSYIPGLGFYGFGLIHIIGNVAKGSTAILRQLIDAGTLANLPGGLKSRGLRIKGDDTPIRPGEWRDVDIATGKVADSIMPLPYKEPSQVLFNLRQQLVEDGRRVGSIADMDVGDMGSEAPVGTTLALIERAQKVMSAVQARLHASLGNELGLIARVIADYMPSQYDYDPEGEFDRKQDFASTGIEIVPVSDPGATTMAQRVVQHQAAIQQASQAPQLYDMPKMHRGGLETLGMKNAAELVPLPEEMKPVDPITENMAIIKGEPVKAFLFQDHKAHIAVHMAAAQDPKIQQMVGQSPNAGMVMAAMQAHLAEHLAYAYRQDMEQQMGQPLPAPSDEIPPEMEAEIARMAVPAAQQLLNQHQQEEAQAQAAAMAADPLIQLQTEELAIKRAEVERKERTDFARMELDKTTKGLSAAVELAKIESQEEISGAKLGVEIGARSADQIARAVQNSEKLAHDERRQYREIASRPKGAPK